MITLMSVNALDLYGSDDPAEEARFAGLEALIRDRDADVIAVQEIISTGEDHKDKCPGAVAGLRRLAEAVGRRCEVAGEPAVAVGGIIHHTGLLWRDGIEPVPGTLHPLTREGAGMWHCAVAAVFDLGGPKARIGSVQLSPFDQTWARMDTSQLLRVFNRDDIPGFLGGDFNGIGAQQVVDEDGYSWYDHDPYVGRSAPPWHPDHAYQLGEDGLVDRQAAVRLEHPRLGRMRDCAVITGTGWIPTTGFHPADRNPDRRIDRWYATHHAPDAAIAAYRVVPLEQVRILIDDRPVELTDHNPIEVDVDEHALAGGADARPWNASDRA
ncbi:hypothetical protein ALI22I_01890 [Saccharothrix sp. ALI-22-I]|uniref:endonuclease/exonuclease/phosphatase family protein n=1 Tax=Saccharothrix sp. ALI-22-I TaxID=1933778 RepID=UPI00097CBD13|nr:endonuclease/exonuclease/phosphatase family protein [Saccharothrix sp. ALI-22-I]ONI92801.1 hypothetical protein ALI22I_01890 [Saccharothrix sp. ALI-22-I]